MKLQKPSAMPIKDAAKRQMITMIAHLPKMNILDDFCFGIIRILNVMRFIYR